MTTVQIAPRAKDTAPYATFWIVILSHPTTGGVFCDR